MRRETDAVDWRRVTSLDPNQYPLFPNLAAVPRTIFTNPHLIVEKFLPEREGDLYCLRNWIGLGDVGENVRAFSEQPIVKAAVAFGHTPVPVPAELTAWRQAIGMDYGKIDYVMPAGRLVVLDVNPTPTYRGPDPHPLLQSATQSMAQALLKTL
ncbi:MAG: hypothetical protein IGQ88_07110 [Gloeomargaritaceae cyanobacterium C42_A2020_066]|nr:hypothetical protein [Gloeomargaritaceae cyanobacterium C42_A2020_066]